MLPAAVSIRKPAWPTLVTCTNSLPRGGLCPVSELSRRRTAALGWPLWNRYTGPSSGCSPALADAGPEVHRHRRWRICPPPAARWSRSTTPAISTSPSPGLPAYKQQPRPQGAVHGQEGGLRPQDHRARSCAACATSRSTAPAAPRRSTQACRRLKAGELVGVYPEATISRSFEIKEFKSGAARMAIAADVPIVPHIVWGAQRIWTKGHPKKMWRPKVPISIAVGEPIQPTLPPTELTALLHSRMQHLLEQVQDEYGPHPPGSSGCRTGSAAERRRWPRPNRMDAEEAAEKAARRDAAGPGRSAGVAADGAGFPHAGDRRQRRRRGLLGTPITYLGLENIPARGGAVVAINHTSYVDLLPAALAAVPSAAAAAVHDQGRDAEREGRQLPDQAHRDHSGRPRGRRGRLRRGGRAAAGGRTRRRLPGGHHQPQLRAQGVQVRRGPHGAATRRCRSSR